MDWLDLLAAQGTLQSLLQHTVPKHHPTLDTTLGSLGRQGQLPDPQLVTYIWLLITVSLNIMRPHLLFTNLLPSSQELHL